ncbi:hypothetical protein FDP41_007037 [Naegleria fowleri]|uniref:Uncharacterized protein n=1 Tax=Naegleria fowleri TaxID=5763 RepID=A0A6A5B5M0_NAEFO|nr:uncharacterized protein FDP41_007037 [Naegleria fowleri]KAF0973953.1 hypothetical protein FDP41_007037 [Naegleria fowleri]
MHLLNEQYIWVLMLCYLKDPFSDRSQYIWKEEFCLTRKLYEPNRIEPLVMMILLDDQSNHHLHADSTIGIDGDTKNHSNGVHGDHGDHSNFNHTCSPPNLEYSSGLGGFNLLKDYGYMKVIIEKVQRFVDTKNCVDDTFIVSVITSNQELPPQHSTKVYELGGSLTVSQDEWMYELADQQKKNKWNSYNQACQLYFEKDYRGALEMFQEFYQSNTNDKPAEHMIRLCEQLLHH